MTEEELEIQELREMEEFFQALSLRYDQAAAYAFAAGMTQKAQDELTKVVAGVFQHLQLQDLRCSQLYWWLRGKYKPHDLDRIYVGVNRVFNDRYVIQTDSFKKMGKS